MASGIRTRLSSQHIKEKTGHTRKGRKTAKTSSSQKFTVERILAYRDVDDQRQYQVKWAGCGMAAATWEDEETLLEDCAALVDHFLNSVLTGQDVKETYDTYLYTVDLPNAVVRQCKIEIVDEIEYICSGKRFLRVYINKETKVAIFVRLYDKESLIPANSCSKDNLHISRGVKCKDIIPNLAEEEEFAVPDRLKRVVSLLSSSKFYILGEKEYELASSSIDALQSSAIAFPKAKLGEFATNGIVKMQIDLLVSEFLHEGFVVQGQQSSSTNYYTRFATSQPDLAIYKALSDSVYGIAGFMEETVVGFVEMGASKEVNKDYQTCAGMITLAGELVVQQLTKGALVSSVVVLGLSVNYSTVHVKMYKLRMNFVKGTTSIVCSTDDVPLLDGFMRILTIFKLGKDQELM